MAKDRLTLQTELETLLNSSRVYFQPPAGYQLRYPCIVYQLDDIDKTHANNKKYFGLKRYLITVMDLDPDTIIHEKVLEMPYSSFEDHFVADNINHYICSLYY